ncbi:MAG: nucleotide exchange factor GrpE [Patescibacteria group bacterium]
MSDTNDVTTKDEKDLKIEELETCWKRALADYKNLERRFSEEREVIVKFSNALLLERLLPILDNLESVCSHLTDTGLEMTAKEFRTILKDAGVEEILVEGGTFNPELMEATEIVEGEEDKVVKVILKGFKFFDKVLRPARVIVSKNKG